MRTRILARQLTLSIPSLCAAIACAVSLASCSGAPARSGESSGGVKHEKIPLVGAYQVHRYTLPNGLRLLIVEDHTSPTLAYQTWFRVGSRDEVPGYTGLAHLFEHMMFKGTKTHKDGEFDRMLEEAGAEGENAFTNNDYTAYIQEMPADKLELIASLEADRMVNLVVDQKAFKTETDVVQNERRFRNENNPDGMLWQTLAETAFTKHSYHWPVIGYQEDLDRMSNKEATDFYKAYYAPNHATVIVVGDVDPGKTLAIVQKHYGGLKATEPPANKIEAEPTQTAPRRKQLKLSIQVEKLLMGYHIPDANHDDIASINMLQAILSAGKSSRLHRALVETGICGSIEVGGAEDKDPSLFTIGCNLQKGRKAAQAEAVILSEITRLGREPVSASELERARNRVDFGFYEGLDSNYEKAYFLGRYQAVAPSFERGLAIRAQMREVAPPMIQAAARKYLDPKNRTVITGVRK